MDWVIMMEEMGRSDASMGISILGHCHTARAMLAMGSESQKIGETNMTEYEDLSPKFKNALMARHNSVSPFWTLLGMELLDVKKGWAKVRLPYDKKLNQAMGIAHGGAIFALADSAAAIALLGMVPKTQTFTTVESKINFIRAFNRGEIVAEARVVNKGSTIVISDVDVTDDKGRLIAKYICTLMILKNPRYDKV